jgi:hypothetical protein
VEASLGTTGTSLLPEVRAFFERRLGHDFSRVRIHDGESADKAARSVNAKAYTLANHIVFRRSRFQPGSPAGLRLLAHELAHVVQQTGTSTAMAPLGITRTRRPLIQRDGDDEPHSSWKASDATASYALTDADKKVLESQTSEERARDRERLKLLTAPDKGGKKRSLSADEQKEVSELRARIQAAQGPLKRKDVEDVLKAAGYTVQQWFGGIRQGRFLGIPLRVHSALADRLDKAQAALVADPKVNPGHLAPDALGKALGMYPSSSDLRAPAAAVGGSKLSLHTFGLAVDLNYTGDPFLGNTSKQMRAGPKSKPVTVRPGLEVVRRATSLVNERPIDLTAKGPKSAPDAYVYLKEASDAFKVYFSYLDPARRSELEAKVAKHTAVSGEPGDVDSWLSQIKQDKADLTEPGADFDARVHKPLSEGFLDLNEQVVKALAAAGLTWGGTYPGARDIMHFDLREGEGAKIEKARREHTDNQ